MPRFFLSHFNKDESITISGDDAHHISHSLRMAPGESIEVCNLEEKCAFRAEIDKITASDVFCHVTETLDNNGEPPYQVTLYQALPKSDKMDLIVQKAVECGVSEIVPFASSRCIVRLKDLDVDKKKGRWNRIAFEAAKQCGRSYLPQINRMINYADVLIEFSNYDLVLFCYEGGHAESLKKVLSEQKDQPLKIAIVIGSEGGFSQEEADAAFNSGAKVVNLGRRILRTETASSVILSVLTYVYELNN